MTPEKGATLPVDPSLTLPLRKLLARMYSELQIEAKKRLDAPDSATESPYAPPSAPPYADLPKSRDHGENKTRKKHGSAGRLYFRLFVVLWLILHRADGDDSGCRI